MAATGASLLAAWLRLSPSPQDRASSSPPALNGSLQRRSSEGNSSLRQKKDSALVDDYFEEAKALISAGGRGGPPRWFSPLECAGGTNKLKNAPLLLYLPGIDGVGVGLTRHHRRLGKMFDVWCLHIPVMDRTPFTDLVKGVEDTVRQQYSHSPRRPIYLVGESLGGCLAMVVAARNPHIDLVLILANPTTSFNKSLLQGLAPFLSIPYLLSVIRGDRLLAPQAFKDLWGSLLALSSNFSAIADILPRETLLWKMELLKLGASHANARLHSVKAQTLVLSSGMDPLFPSREEGERLHDLLPRCEIRKFNDNGHFLFLEDGVDIVTIIKSTSFYRRGRNPDFVADYLPLNSSEYSKLCEQHRWFDVATSPVFFSTLDNGEIVRGLSGIPSKGPVLLVGHHMRMGVDVFPILSRMFYEKNIALRVLAHPVLFMKPGESKKLGSSLLDTLKIGSSLFDTYRLMGATPVSGTNMFKLLSSNSHVLLFPGGIREALCLKGEDYHLFWSQESEFVRMAARFGATIIPFGSVGVDDISELVVDYDDYMRIPYFKKEIEDITNKCGKLRTNTTGEVANQPMYIPGILPKPPGRFYYLFGKPIKTEGRKDELKDRQKARELYWQVKLEVKRCVDYLKEKREQDPYRSILSRTLYQSVNGFASEVPTFEP